MWVLGTAGDEINSSSTSYSLWIGLVKYRKDAIAVLARRMVAAGMWLPTECRRGKRLALNRESGNNLLIYSLLRQDAQHIYYSYLFLMKL